VWRRGCLFGCGGLLILCVVALGLGYFIGLPKVQDAIANDFQDGIATVVTDGITSGNQSTGVLVITEDQINSVLNTDVENSDVSSQITPNGVSIEFTYRNDNSDPIRYSAVPVVSNGQFKLTDVEATNGFMERVLPKDKLANAIEDGVNDTLAEHNLQLASIDLEDGQITLQAVPAS
jgi:hypothetical protein